MKFKIRLLTFALNVLWEEACRIGNGSSFHSFGPEYVKVFLKSSVFAFGIFNFSLTFQGQLKLYTSWRTVTSNDGHIIWQIILVL